MGFWSSTALAAMAMATKMATRRAVMKDFMFAVMFGGFSMSGQVTGETLKRANRAFFNGDGFNKKGILLVWATRA